MTKKNEFIVLTVLLLLTRLGDGISTYLATPDLSQELNPIESVLGLGWLGLFIANVIIILLIIYMNYYQLFKYKMLTDNCKINSKKEFVSYLYYKRPDVFSWIYYRIPRNGKPIVSHFGYSMPRMFIFFGLLLIANNLMGAYNFIPYVELMNLSKYSYVFLYALGVIVGMYFYIVRINIEYKEYIKKQQKQLVEK